MTSILFTFLSFLLVALGQPAWSSWIGIIASALGYALFWQVLLQYPSKQKRFWVSFGWFFSIQLVQLSWFLAHPYWYIIAVYLTASALMSVQFGILGIFISPAKLRSYLGMASVAGIWTLLEWSRQFILSGFSWNPIGMSLSGNVYSLQMTALAGMLGLSFWVVFVNLLALRAWISRSWKSGWIWCVAACLPYLFGWTHLVYHEQKINNAPLPILKTLLVQTAFPIEELEESPARKDIVKFVMQEWRTILELSKKHDKEIDLLVLPEFVVPYGAYALVYPLHEVQQSFYEVLGLEGLKSLPSINLPYASFINTDQGMQLMVDNAFWVQGLANYYQAYVLTGMEDSEDIAYHKREYYSSALLFPPQTSVDQQNYITERYEKRILVPMGEYIPFEFCRELAARYGVTGSFTCGKEAKSFDIEKAHISPSICYEETFGDIMREGRLKGADVYVNLTSDVWYPNSSLPRQHFEHARPRAVENGVPLLRACNTGITAAVDSLGRDISVLGGNSPEKVEWVADSLYSEVPLYSYRTLYTFAGDRLMAGISLLFVFFYSYLSFRKS